MRYFIVFVESENDKISEREEKRDEMTLSIHLSSLLILFIALLYFTLKEQVNPAHATNQYHPDDDLVSNSCNLSYIYTLKVSLKSRPYVIIGKILDGPPAAVI